jgi:urease accessory protein
MIMQMGSTTITIITTTIILAKTMGMRPFQVIAMADGQRGIPASIASPTGQMLQLLAWLSPAFPVGAFSYSHGIEQAVEAGLVTDRQSTADWITTILRQGAGWIDAGLFLATHRAVAANDIRALQDAPLLAAAWRGTAETALEAGAQGAAFVTTLNAGWDLPTVKQWFTAIATPPAYAVAVAIAAAASGIAEEPALAAYLQAFAANLISAAQRLVPLGQTDGQRILASITTDLAEIVAAARLLPPDDLGSAAVMVDWTSAQHETQYTRLFRS